MNKIKIFWDCFNENCALRIILKILKKKMCTTFNWCPKPLRAPKRPIMNMIKKQPCFLFAYRKQFKKIRH